MTKKARYFFIGGAEPEQEEVVNNDELVNNIDSLDEDSIDKIISFIRDNIDDKSSEGIAQLGKHEYIKKVLKILDTNISPIFPTMSGGAYEEKIKRAAMDQLQTLINEISNKIGDVIVTKENTKEGLNIPVEENSNRPLYNAIDKSIYKTIFKYIDEPVDDVIPEKVIDDINENILNENKQDLSYSVYRGPKGKYAFKFFITGDDIPSGTFTEIINEFKGISKITKKGQLPGKTLLDKIITFLRERKDEFKDIINNLELESIKPEVPFNLMVLHNFSHILELSEEGFKDRVLLQEKLPKPIMVIVDGKQIKKTWTDDLELALRGENELAKILYDAYNVKGKYENFFQLISSDDSFASLDITVGNMGYVEVKGFYSGGVELNKLIHFCNEYNKGRGIHKFYGLARPVVSDTLQTEIQKVQSETIDNKEKFKRIKQMLLNESNKTGMTFENFDITVIPTAIIKFLADGKNMSKLQYYYENKDKSYDFITKLSSILGLQSGDVYDSKKGITSRELFVPTLDMGHEYTLRLNKTTDKSDVTYEINKNKSAKVPADIMKQLEELFK